MKWQVVEPTQGQYDWSGGDRLVRFAEAHGQLVRGHVLLWHNQLPSWLTTGVNNGTISNDQLRRILRRHILTEVSHFKGEIWQWDVANEFFTDSNPSTINPNDFWVSHLGPGIIADAFRWAHAADRKALLCYNDYNDVGEDGSNAKFTAIYNWLKSALAQGVPIDCVGSQSHLDLQYGFPNQMQSDLQQYASLGLKVAITEADVRTFIETSDNQQRPTNPLAPSAQADWYDRMLRACLFVRACISFTTWEFSDDQSWIPGVFHGEGYANIYDVNLNPKPAYFVMRDDLRLAAYGAPHRPNTGGGFGESH
jgi:endo-1,4-beta-xylanase